jgi:hypothetical protein
MSGSLEDALSQARRERPRPLPADFADGVMARLHRAARPVIRPREWLAMAAAAVVTAWLIPLASAPRDRAAGPPAMGLFGDDGGASLFATR